MDKAMETAPDVIYWQGQDLYLKDIRVFEGKAQSINLKGVIRFSYADKKGHIRLMQWQFPNNPPIDWERLENENREAPENVHYRVLSANKKAVYERQWYARNKTRLMRLFAQTRHIMTMQGYEAEIANDRLEQRGGFFEGYARKEE